MFEKYSIKKSLFAFFIGMGIGINLAIQTLPPERLICDEYLCKINITIPESLKHIVGDFPYIPKMSAFELFPKHQLISIFFLLTLPILLVIIDALWQ
jgi:hypothetical protein